MKKNPTAQWQFLESNLQAGNVLQHLQRFPARRGTWNLAGEADVMFSG